jgi:hypothetical protein
MLRNETVWPVILNSTYRSLNALLSWRDPDIKLVGHPLIMWRILPNPTDIVVHNSMKTSRRKYKRVWLKLFKKKNSYFDCLDSNCTTYPTRFIIKTFVHYNSLSFDIVYYQINFYVTLPEFNFFCPSNRFTHKHTAVPRMFARCHTGTYKTSVGCPRDRRISAQEGVRRSE